MTRSDDGRHHGLKALDSGNVLGDPQLLSLNIRFFDSPSRTSGYTYGCILWEWGGVDDRGGSDGAFEGRMRWKGGGNWGVFVHVCFDYVR